jgi:hypothetical protein
MSEQQILSELSVDNIRKHVRHIVETIRSRLAGTPNAARMAEYSAAELQRAGVAARVETIPGLVSFPREAELAILAPEHRILPPLSKLPRGGSMRRPSAGTKISCRCYARQRSRRSSQHMHQAVEPRPAADCEHRQRHIRPRHVLVHAPVHRDPLPVRCPQACAHGVERPRTLADRDPARA